MSQSNNSKYPNIITYVRNVIEPFIIAIKGLFRDIREKLDELKNLEDSVTVTITGLSDGLDARFDTLREELYDRIDSHIAGEDVLTIDEARVLKLKELDELQETVSAQGFTWDGSTFKGDYHSVQVLTALGIRAINTAADGSTFAETLTLADGTTRIVHDYEFASIMEAFITQKGVINSRKDELIALVYSTLTVEEILSITWEGIVVPPDPDPDPDPTTKIKIPCNVDGIEVFEGETIYWELPEDFFSSGPGSVTDSGSGVIGIYVNGTMISELTESGVGSVIVTSGGLAYWNDDLSSSAPCSLDSEELIYFYVVR